MGQKQPKQSLIFLFFKFCPSETRLAGAIKWKQMHLQSETRLPPSSKAGPL